MRTFAILCLFFLTVLGAPIADAGSTAEDEQLNEYGQPNISKPLEETSVHLLHMKNARPRRSARYPDLRSMFRSKCQYCRQKYINGFPVGPCVPNYEWVPCKPEDMPSEAELLAQLEKEIDKALKDRADRRSRIGGSQSSGGLFGRGSVPSGSSADSGQVKGGGMIGSGNPKPSGGALGNGGGSRASGGVFSASKSSSGQVKSGGIFGGGNSKNSGGLLGSSGGSKASGTSGGLFGSSKDSPGQVKSGGIMGNGNPKPSDGSSSGGLLGKSGASSGGTSGGLFNSNPKPNSIQHSPKGPAGPSSASSKNGQYGNYRQSEYNHYGLGSYGRTAGFRATAIGGYVSYEGTIRNASKPIIWNGRSYYMGEHFYDTFHQGHTDQSILCKMPIESDDQFKDILLPDKTRPKEIVWSCPAGMHCCGLECCPSPAKHARPQMMMKADSSAPGLFGGAASAFLLWLGMGIIALL